MLTAKRVCSTNEYGMDGSRTAETYQLTYEGRKRRGMPCATLRDQCWIKTWDPDQPNRDWPWSCWWYDTKLSFYFVCLQDSSTNREDFPYFRPLYTVCVIHLSRTSLFCLDI